MAWIDREGQVNNVDKACGERTGSIPKVGTLNKMGFSETDLGEHAPLLTSYLLGPALPLRNPHVSIPCLFPVSGQGDSGDSRHGVQVSSWSLGYSHWNLLAQAWWSSLELWQW